MLCGCSCLHVAVVSAGLHIHICNYHNVAYYDYILLFAKIVISVLGVSIGPGFETRLDHRNLLLLRGPLDAKTRRSTSFFVYILHHLTLHTRTLFIYCYIYRHIYICICMWIYIFCHVAISCPPKPKRNCPGSRQPAAGRQRQQPTTDNRQPGGRALHQRTAKPQEFRAHSGTVRAESRKTVDLVASG
jgi:hypothetical protein